MTEAVAELYTRLLHENLRQYAAWPIGSSLRLGDYGTIDGHIFKPIDNITTQFKIPCKDAISPVNIVFEYKSAGVAETKLNAGASVSIPGANISGSLKTELKFASNNSLYFRSIRLVYSHIDNFAEVSSAILEKFSAGQWSGSFALIHSLFSSGGTTIIATNGDNAAIQVEASVKGLEQFDLADASAGLTSTDNGYVGFKVLASDKLVPLFGLAQIKPRFSWLPFLGGRTVQPMLTERATSGKTPLESGMLPGHIIVNQKPHITPDMAKDIGKSVEEVFQVEEIA